MARRDACSCADCRAEQRSYRRQYSAENPTALRLRQKRQYSRMEAATPNPKPRSSWSRDEIEVAARADLTTTEKAVLLNRSYRSVQATVGLIKSGRWGDVRFGYQDS
jgi:hypothetical protein